MVIGHARTCLKNNIVTEYGTRTPKHKQVTFVKRENCTVVKRFKPNMSSVDQYMGYCFATAATKSLNGVVPCIERHRSSAEYPGKEIGQTLFAFFDDFQTSTSQSSFNNLCVSSINRVDEILPMVYHG